MAIGWRSVGATDGRGDYGQCQDSQVRWYSVRGSGSLTHVAMKCSIVVFWDSYTTPVESAYVPSHMVFKLLQKVFIKSQWTCRIKTLKFSHFNIEISESPEAIKVIIF